MNYKIDMYFLRERKEIHINFMIHCKKKKKTRLKSSKTKTEFAYNTNNNSFFVI